MIFKMKHEFIDRFLTVEPRNQGEQFINMYSVPDINDIENN